MWCRGRLHSRSGLPEKRRSIFLFLLRLRLLRVRSVLLQLRLLLREF